MANRSISLCGGEGKGGKYLKKENIFLCWRRKTEKEKEENIGRRKISFFSVEEKNGEEKGGRYLVDGGEEKKDGQGGKFS